MIGSLLLLLIFAAWVSVTDRERAVYWFEGLNLFWQTVVGVGLVLVITIAIAITINKIW
jgi:hypothetical protein